MSQDNPTPSEVLTAFDEIRLDEVIRYPELTFLAIVTLRDELRESLAACESARIALDSYLYRDAS